MIHINKTIVYIRLRPRCAICCHCIRRQSQTVWHPWRIVRWKFDFLLHAAQRSLGWILPTPYAVGPIPGKHDVIHKTGSTQRIQLSSEEDRATAPDNTYRKFHEVWTCGFWDIWADGQIGIKTRWSQYFSPYRGRSKYCKIWNVFTSMGYIVTRSTSLVLNR